MRSLRGLNWPVLIHIRLSRLRMNSRTILLIWRPWKTAWTLPQVSQVWHIQERWLWEAPTAPNKLEDIEIDMVDKALVAKLQLWRRKILKLLLWKGSKAITTLHQSHRMLRINNLICSNCKKTKKFLRNILNKSKISSLIKMLTLSKMPSRPFQTLNPSLKATKTRMSMDFLKAMMLRTIRSWALPFKGLMLD